jgi:hypothetical protein
VYNAFKAAFPKPLIANTAEVFINTNSFTA